MRWLVVLSVFIGLGFGSSTPAHADEFSDAVQALNADNNTDKAAAIEALSATGDERAATVLSALLNGTLFYRQSDGLVVLSKESGNVTILIDPSTMNEVADVSGSEAKKIRINNKLRGQLKGVLGALTLLSKDADKRQNAADEVFKANDPSMLPVLQKAIARESDPDVKGRMLRAQAAIILEYSEDTAARLKAAQTLGEFTDPDISALLGKIANTSTDPEVKKLAKDMQDSVEGRLAAWSFLGNLFQGVSLGSVLLLAAVGLAITFGVMGVINMAHGEMVMLGAYTTFMVQDVIRTHFPAAFDWSLAIAVPAAFLVTGAVGILVERGIIRWLYGRPLETLLATWGLSLMLQQLIRTLFGPTNQEVGNPSWMSGAIETSTGLVLTYNRIWIIVFSLAVLGMLALVTRKTMFGLQMRAVTQNRAMANSMGIRSGWVDALTFALGSGIAGMAGVALSQIDNVSPNLGQTYIIDSFMVVVFGGVGNLWGTLVGAFSLGIVNKFLEPYAGAVLGKIFVLVGIILFIQKRPRGLFALKGRSVEG
ncbi:urea ABC transporter permease subunit UrtB [Magnetovibrio blakemorei]|uniref:Urea ABC transporter permease subunit UrtB n=2 Tax=Magnetovibrio blakemorei TaxID=28181 RepID=A0A1E5QBX2_9PROT|nr:urea ABC transporter permease subunit UrtB [Magnetovibrio blakemorei]